MSDSEIITIKEHSLDSKKEKKMVNNEEKSKINVPQFNSEVKQVKKKVVFENVIDSKRILVESNIEDTTMSDNDNLGDDQKSVIGSEYTGVGSVGDVSPGKEYDKILINRRVKSLIEYSKADKPKQVAFLQIFRERELEIKFLTFYYGRKIIMLRIAMIVASGLLAFAFFYDFILFERETFLDLPIRITFQVLRFIEALLGVCVTIALNIPMIYKLDKKVIIEFENKFTKNKILVEIVVGIFLTSMFTISTFHTSVGSGRSVITTILFCAFALFRLRVYILFIASFLSIITYGICLIFFYTDLNLSVTTLSSMFVIMFVELIYLYFYEAIFRDDFIENLFLSKLNESLLKEQERENHILMNIFPKHLISEIKKSKNIQNFSYVKKVNSIVIIAIDIVRFTSWCNQTKSKQVIHVLNRYYSTWDDICESFGIEKITTIGDAYLAISTIHTEETRKKILEEEKRLQKKESLKYSLEVRSIAAVLKMIAYFNKLSSREKSNLQVRCGCTIGALCLAIIGKQNRRFDIFGNNVRIAFKLESQSLPSSIHVSSSLMKITKAHFKYRKSSLKSEGESTYFVTTQYKDIPKSMIPPVIKKQNDAYFIPMDIESNMVEKYISDNESEVIKSYKEKKRNEREERKYEKRMKRKMNERKIYKTNWFLLAFIKPFWKNSDYIKDLQKTTKNLFAWSFVSFILLETITLLNFMINADFSWYFLIPICLITFSIIAFIFSILTLRIFYIGFYLSFFFSLIFPSIYIFSVYLCQTLTPQSNDMYSKLMLDMYVFTYPFMIFIFPSVPFHIKFIFALLTNFPFHYVMWRTTGRTVEVMNFLVMFASISVGFYMFHYRTLKFYESKETTKHEIKLLRMESKYNERLLNQALPRKISDRLLTNRELNYDRYNRSFVMFAIVRNTEKIQDHHVLVRFLGRLFSTFDSIVEKNGIMKIKNINTTYLCIHGKADELVMNEKSSKSVYYKSNDEEVKLFGMQMFETAYEFHTSSKEILRKEIENNNSEVADVYITIGCNYGNFSAGVIGKKKIIYDVFGDTINETHRYSGSFFHNVSSISCSDKFVKENEEFFQSEEIEFSQHRFELKGKGLCTLHKYESKRIKMEDVK